MTPEQVFENLITSNDLYKRIKAINFLKTGQIPNSQLNAFVSLSNDLENFAMQQKGTVVQRCYAITGLAACSFLSEEQRIAGLLDISQYKQSPEEAVTTIRRLQDFKLFSKMRKFIAKYKGSTVEHPFLPFEGAAKTIGEELDFFLATFNTKVM